MTDTPWGFKFRPEDEILEQRTIQKFCLMPVPKGTDIKQNLMGSLGVPNDKVVSEALDRLRWLVHSDEDVAKAITSVWTILHRMKHFSGESAILDAAPDDAA